MPFIRYITILYICLALPKNIFGDEGFFMERLLNQWHPQLNHLNQKVSALQQKLAALPELKLRNRSIQFGYHSRLFFKPDHPHWIRIDLGKHQKIDMIALIPAHAETMLSTQGDYGFPAAFVVEILDDKKKNPVVVAEKKPSTIAQKGYPYLIHCPEKTMGRYVQIRILEHWKTLEHWTTVLSEVMVIQGQHNIAAYQPVESSENQELKLPGWSPNYLTDHQSPLGPPVSREVSPSNGLLCSFWKSRDRSEQYMQIDLEVETDIDCIVLYPSRPTDYADSPGSGFPLHFRISGSDEPGFQNEKVLYEVIDRDYTNPGDNPVTLQMNPVKVRYIRFTALKLFDRQNRKSVSLAEIELYSKGINVAYGKPVSSPHAFISETYPRWYPQALVDGFNSQFKILSLPQWLEQLEQRKGLSLQLESLRAKIEMTRSQAMITLVSLSVVLVVFVVIWSIMMLRRYAKDRRRVEEQLREQISRDLHDEIGSQLGGIALLSNSHLGREDIPGDLKEDLLQISQVACESGDAMKDIIWLVKEEECDLKELLNQIKRIGRRTLTDYNVIMEASPQEWPEEVVNLEVRRHLTLAFKEILHNIIKHAKAHQVKIQLNLKPEYREITMKIKDDGIGFESMARSDGMGLSNLKKRAEMLNGNCHISSGEASGTEIEFGLRY